jgi:hypothetical protein
VWDSHSTLDFSDSFLHDNFLLTGRFADNFLLTGQFADNFSLSGWGYAGDCHTNADNFLSAGQFAYNFLLPERSFYYA